MSVSSEFLTSDAETQKRKKYLEAGSFPKSRAMFVIIFGMTFFFPGLLKTNIRSSSFLYCTIEASNTKSAVPIEFFIFEE
jgi:hypothetical protein